MQKTAITVARGDGIGPEITDATLRILEAAGAQLEIEHIEVGRKVYESGNTSGIEDSSWESLRRTRCFLKGPITTPQGGGWKSLNVTLRKTLGLFANVRPVRSFAPHIMTVHPGMNIVIVRENEEDLYAGIEHRQTDEVYQSLKIISRPGSERVIRYAFELAKTRARKHLTCMTKDNILKLADGVFHKIFDEVAKEYPEVETDHMIVDIGMARVASEPERFDVVVTPNLYGDIVSDIAAEISGSVGMAGSMNIGQNFAMFEAVHGSAPDIAGRDIANPSGILQAGIRMLTHIGQGEVAEKVQNAWLCALEDGMHTIDIYREGHSKQRVGTQAFADAVIERLDKEPHTLLAVHYPQDAIEVPAPVRQTPAKKDLVGSDVFVHWSGTQPDELGSKLVEASKEAGLELEMMTNRGVKVWPSGFPETFCTDHWRCRFRPRNGEVTTPADVVALLGQLVAAGIDCIKTENLYHFDGVPGFSLGQGQ